MLLSRNAKLCPKCVVYKPSDFIARDDLLFQIIIGDDQKGALKVLFLLLCLQPKKKAGDFMYLFKEFEV